MAQKKMTLTEATLHFTSFLFVLLIMAQPSDSYVIAGIACACFFAATVSETIRTYSLLRVQRRKVVTKKKKKATARDPGK